MAYTRYWFNHSSRSPKEMPNGSIEFRTRGKDFNETQPPGYFAGANDGSREVEESFQHYTELRSTLPREWRDIPIPVERWTPEREVSTPDAIDEQVKKLSEQIKIPETAYHQHGMENTDRTQDNIEPILSTEYDISTPNDNLEKGQCEGGEADIAEILGPRRSGRIRQRPDMYTDTWTTDRQVNHIAINIEQSPMEDFENGEDHIPFMSLLACTGQPLRDMIKKPKERRSYDPRNPTRRQADKGPEAAEWKVARDAELHVHATRPTWRDLQPGEIPKDIQNTHWIHTTKPITNKKKARLVVLGNGEKTFRGDTFAPTASRSVMWLLFAIAIVLQLATRVVDITRILRG